MNAIMNSLVRRIRIYLIIRRVIRILELVIIPCLFGYFLINKGILVHDFFLNSFGVIVFVFILLEIFVHLYLFILIGELNDLQKIWLEHYNFEIEQSKKLKQQLDEFLSHEQDENLNQNVKDLMAKEKSGDGYLSLNYLRSKTEYSIARMRLRKIIVLKKAIKKWW